MKLPTYEVSQLSLVRVAGADAIKVLNGLCTAKLVELAPGGATEAMFTDDRGRVLAHGIVARLPDQSGAWFLGLGCDAAKLAAHIDRFIFREDAQPKDLSSLWQGWLLDVDVDVHVDVDVDASASPLADDSRNGWLEVAQAFGVAADSGCSLLPHAQLESWLIHFPMTGPNARMLLLPRGAASETDDSARMLAWLGPLGVSMSLGAAEDLEDRRIRNFWPLASVDMDERTLPQELDRDQRAISFTKGCYLGQETVARLDAMGQVQKKLCLVELYGSTPVGAGQSLMREGKEVGKLNSVSSLQHDGKRFGLATMRRGSMAVGTSFLIAAGPEEAGSSGSGSVVAHP